MIHGEYPLQDQPSIALIHAISTLTSELQNMKKQVAVIQQRNDVPSQRHLMGQAAHLKNLERGQQGVAYNRQSGYIRGNRIQGHFKDDCKKLAMSQRTCYSSKEVGNMSHNFPNQGQTGN